MKLIPKQILDLVEATNLFTQTEAQCEALYQEALMRRNTTGEVVKKSFMIGSTAKHRINRNMGQLKTPFQAIIKTLSGMEAEFGAIRQPDEPEKLYFYDLKKVNELREQIIKAKGDQRAKLEKEKSELILAASEACDRYNAAVNAFLSNEDESEEVDLRMVPLADFAGDTSLPSEFFEKYAILIED